MKIKKLNRFSVITYTLLSMVVVAGSSLGLTLATFPEYIESYTPGENVYTCKQTIEGVDYFYTARILSTVNSSGNDAVAITWDTEENASVPSTLTINPTVTISDTSYEVTVIDSGAFRYLSDLQTINLPNTVEEIKYEAFAYTGLTSFTVPDKVTQIAPSTFLDCRSLVTLNYKDSNGTVSLINEKITLIGDHAFDSCVSLKNLVLPYSIRVICESAFQNCTSLLQLYFPRDYVKAVFLASGTNLETDPTGYGYYTDRELTNAATGTVPANDEHGKTYYHLPNQTSSGITITERNTIKVEKYAFSNCSKLVYVYFEDNLKEVSDLAFTNCPTTLKFHYATDKEVSYVDEKKTIPVLPNTFGTEWRDIYIAQSKGNQYGFDLDHRYLLEDTRYPGLRYIVYSNLDNSLDDQLLDSDMENTSPVVIVDSENEDYENNEGTTGYAIICAFTAPTEDQTGYYYVYDETEETGGSIIIPDTVAADPNDPGKGDVYVAAIDKNAFANHLSDIRQVTFNEHLCQIKERAFYGCNNINSLNFTSCEELLEISAYAFSTSDESTYNTSLELLTFPDSLVYIGHHAFYNCSGFNGTSALTFGSGLRLIGNYAFACKSASGNGTVDLVLPASLNDSFAVDARYYAEQAGTDYSNARFAVGKYAFGNAKWIKTVKMEHVNSITHNTSFSTNAFDGCQSLLNFRSNKNLVQMGRSMFSNCNNLKEIFLHTGNAEANKATYSHPWGISENKIEYSYSLFGTTIPHLVIYLDGDVPASLDDYSTYDNTYPWNVDQAAGAYQNALQFDSNAARANGRTKYPTYTNVNWDVAAPTKANNNSDIIYYTAPKSGNMTIRTTFPSVPADYGDVQGNCGCVAFVRTATVNDVKKWTVAKYYVRDAGGNDVRDEFRLDQIPVSNNYDISSNLVAIGPEAFARNTTNTNAKSGYYFVLPDTVTYIGERAFFHVALGDIAPNENYIRGAKIITYKVGNTVQSPNNNEISYANWMKNPVVGKNNWGNAGYCMLPNNITYVGRDAFYNNLFYYVVLGSGIQYLGSGAFYHNDSLKNASLDSVTSTTSNINAVDNCLYYNYSSTGTTDDQMLLFAPNNISGTLSIADNTKAITTHAAANTKYTSIDLNSGLLTIYGGGFAKNTLVTSVTGGTNDANFASIRYISALASTDSNDKVYDSEYTEVFNETDYNILTTGSNPYPFDNVDYRIFLQNNRAEIATTNGAFKGCTSLANLDFTKMTGLRKIGPSAFRDCSALSNMGSTIVAFYDGKQSDATPHVAVASPTGVLDLRSAQHLRVIDRNAFDGCNGIEWVILPNTTGNATNVESNMYIGFDPDYSWSASTSATDRHNEASNAFKAKTNSYTLNILCGETFKQSNVNASDVSLNPGKHYPRNDSKSIYWYGKDNNVYYRIFSAADIDNTNTQTRYWTIYNGRIYLLEDKSKAESFFS